MNRLFYVLLLLAALPLAGSAEKKPLTHSVYDQWQSVGATALSTHGLYTAWEVNPQEGDGTLYLRNNRTGITTAIPRGYRAQIDRGEQYAVALIRPTFAQTRAAKIKKKKADDMPKDSVAIVRLQDMSVTKYANVTGYKLGRENRTAVAFSLGKEKPAKPAADSKDKKKKKKKAAPQTKPAKDAAHDMMVYYFATADTVRIAHAASYDINAQGTLLAYVSRAEKNKHAMHLFDLRTREDQTLTGEARYMSVPQFAWGGDRFVYLSATDTVDTGSRHCDMYEYAVSGGLRVAASRTDAEAVKSGWGLTENSAPSYSRDGKRLFVGLLPYQAPKDTTKYDFETAEPNIWRYDADMVPPIFKTAEVKPGKQKRLCVAEDGRLTPLARSIYDNIRLTDRGDSPYALSLDQTGRMLATQWDLQQPTALSLIDIHSAQRTPITDAHIEKVAMSPDTRHVVWYDQKLRQWMLWERATGKTRDISSQLGVVMYEEDQDTPEMPRPYAGANWTRDSRGVVIADRYDLWYVPVDGSKPLCLTAGAGRRDSICYRYYGVSLPEDPVGISLEKPLYLTVHNYRTKENGVAMTDFQGRLRTLLYSKNNYTAIQKADSADVYTLRRGDFRHPNDLYVATPSEMTQVSHINPWQKDYLWGTPELFAWKAYDGTPLQGILYKPENFDPKRKYPVIIYFYERNSHTLYNYMSPAPSRSIVNIPYFVSNDYLVFVPDIVYKAGHPGESAYNCIVAGAETLARQPWVDGTKMAIQGQSWGGYQVAYLVTRTDMFAAAGAGAPVSNMTSAYGGIRWGSGMSRQFQYEHTQSRIGKDLWSGYDLYIENSPIFKLPNVKTPLLITHNNNDGAVPYYQGIEMFMGLRRLGKPAWLLEYNREAHNLALRKNARDLSVRLSEFFDHYLKGAPMPAWMQPDTPYIIDGKEVVY